MILLICLLPEGSAQTASPTGLKKSFDHSGAVRNYRIHLPKAVKDSKTKVPIVICLHGGGSDAATMSKAGWSELADRRGFIVVYPEGLNGHWNDGRNVRKHTAQNAVTNDVDFLLQLLDELIEKEPVDPTRVYVVGISNGGFMTQRLAVEQTERFAAVAIQIASLPDTYLEGPLKFEPTAPLSVLFMNGTEDPFMPYEGGKLTPNMAPRLIDSESFDFGQGTAIHTELAMELWTKHNNLQPEAVISILPDKDPDDGCEIHHSRWSNDDDTLAVELYKIEGGGHTIPGGTQYLPERIIGKVCGDINGIEVTWDFFESKRR
ncbi:MAG: PHB depolymerase family esterase [Verrucomicrobiales bacterium]|nr:PHB depolymerase family esterase [Verrucomicrobiales bacterium]